MSPQAGSVEKASTPDHGSTFGTPHYQRVGVMVKDTTKRGAISTPLFCLLPNPNGLESWRCVSAVASPLDNSRATLSNTGSGITVVDGIVERVTLPGTFDQT